MKLFQVSLQENWHSASSKIRRRKSHLDAKPFLASKFGSCPLVAVDWSQIHSASIFWFRRKKFFFFFATSKIVGKC